MATELGRSALLPGELCAFSLLMVSLCGIPLLASPHIWYITKRRAGYHQHDVTNQRGVVVDYKV